MKKLLCIIILFFSFTLVALADDDDSIPSGLKMLQDFSRDINGAFRFFGGGGYTFKYNNDAVDRISYGGGGQAFLIFGNRLFYVGFGIDGGYFHLYNATDGLSNESYNVASFHGLTEISFSSFFFQIGLGPQFLYGDGTNTYLGLMAAIGYDLFTVNTENTFITVPLIVRSTYIFTDSTIISLSITLGVTFYIPD